MAHAQLFVGPEGALSLPLVIAFATYIHCQDRGADDACGTCPACAKSLKLVHPDTHFVFPLSNIKGDKDDERFRAEMMKSWRSFLLEQPFGNLSDWTTYYGGEDKQAIISREESREIVKTLSLKPFESQYKIMIIWLPELMHPSAANGILKILEEPSANTLFFLITGAADQLLPTIISRTQVVSVPRLTDDNVKRYLVDVQNTDASKAAQITMLADGDLRHAIQLIDHEDDDNAQRFIEWMRACFKKKYDALVPMAEAFHALDRLSQKNWLLYSVNAFRECLLLLSGAEKIGRATGEERKFLGDFSAVLSLEKIEKSFTLMNNAGYHLERNGSAKMIFLDLSVKIAQIINPST
jgi:DNA polymerase-3 subunit delta'